MHSENTGVTVTQKSKIYQKKAEIPAKKESKVQNLKSKNYKSKPKVKATERQEKKVPKN